MRFDQSIVRTLYRRLLSFYPIGFREQLAESMEQTFNDLCDEKRQTKKGLFRFLLWTFIETSMGILREHLLLISPGEIMQTIVKPIGSSAGISLLLILPFMIMEILNRRQFNEEFPFVLFFGLWLNLFAITLILFPIVRAMQKGKDNSANPVPAPGNALLANPKPALAISVVLILSVVLVGLLESLGGGLTESMSNGSNSEQLYVWGIRIPSQFIALMVISMPIAAGIIAGVPIVSALRAGGSLFAHPIHLMIVVFIASILVIGFANFIIDQWPCFIGIPNCD